MLCEVVVLLGKGRLSSGHCICAELAAAGRYECSSRGKDNGEVDKTVFNDYRNKAKYFRSSIGCDDTVRRK